MTSPDMNLDEAPLTDDKSCLLVDDDNVFAQRFAKALLEQGLIVSVATSVADALDIVTYNPPRYAVIDLNIAGESGLQVIEALKQKRPEARSIILTGYGNLPNAVAAAKTGANHFLPKPATVEEVVRALRATESTTDAASLSFESGDEVRLKHIHSV
ncbi:MAG: response regulator, partial [Pseudomonadota bacterium]